MEFQQCDVVLSYQLFLRSFEARSYDYPDHNVSFLLYQNSQDDIVSIPFQCFPSVTVIGINSGLIESGLVFSHVIPSQVVFVFVCSVRQSAMIRLLTNPDEIRY